MNSDFSQRMGLKPMIPLLQLGSMNEALRNGLWNVLQQQLFSKESFVEERFTSDVWSYYFKKAVDSRPITIVGYGKASYRKVWEFIRGHFFSSEWNEVYDFTEFVVRYFPSEIGVRRSIQATLERENSGYRLIKDRFVPISDEQEVSEVAEAAKSPYSQVNDHLKSAISLLADRTNPDYRNSIKESISAVEAMAKLVSGNEKTTLDDALKTLEKRGVLHSALRSGFSKIYGYTSDANGIRHALMSESDLTQADARYFLVACSAFINLLKARVAI